MLLSGAKFTAALTYPLLLTVYREVLELTRYMMIPWVLLPATLVIPPETQWQSALRVLHPWTRSPL